MVERTTRTAHTAYMPLGVLPTVLYWPGCLPFCSTSLRNF